MKQLSILIIFKLCFSSYLKADEFAKCLDRAQSELSRIGSVPHSIDWSSENRNIKRGVNEYINVGYFSLDVWNTPNVIAYMQYKINTSNKKRVNPGVLTYLGKWKLSGTINSKNNLSYPFIIEDENIPINRSKYLISEPFYLIFGIFQDNGNESYLEIMKSNKSRKKMEVDPLDGNPILIGESEWGDYKMKIDTLSGLPVRIECHKNANHIINYKGEKYRDLPAYTESKLLPAERVVGSFLELKVKTTNSLQGKIYPEMVEIRTVLKFKDGSDVESLDKLEYRFNLNTDKTIPNPLKLIPNKSVMESTESDFYYEWNDGLISKHANKKLIAEIEQVKFKKNTNYWIDNLIWIFPITCLCVYFIIKISVAWKTR